MSRKILIGSTGLVGLTLKESINFDFEFNSKNINDFPKNDYSNCEIYLSCLPATKWLVNKDIKSDIKNINSIIESISKIRYKRVILISTIDVYCESPQLSDEDSPIHMKNLSYGINRYYFELLIANLLTYDDLKIFRLPALFNKHIKKNILYDLLNGNNIQMINSNSSFQWYNLDNLSNDIDLYIKNYPDGKVFNLFTEPVETKEILKFFPNHINKVSFQNDRIEYNFKTKYSDTGYIVSKDIILEQIKNFIYEFSCK